MFVICLLICFIINGDASLGQDVEIDSPINHPDAAEVSLTEDVLQNRLDIPITNAVEGRAKQRLIKGKIKLMVKALMLFKLLLFIVSLPLSAITAKILSWNAVAISLLALLTSKLVLLRSFFPGITSQPPPSPPIIIQSSPDPVRRFRAGPKIYIQPDLHIPDQEEEPQRRKRWFFYNRYFLSTEAAGERKHVVKHPW